MLPSWCCFGSRCFETGILPKVIGHIYTSHVQAGIFGLAYPLHACMCAQTGMGRAWLLPNSKGDYMNDFLPNAFCLRFGKYDMFSKVQLLDWQLANFFSPVFFLDEKLTWELVPKYILDIPKNYFKMIFVHHISEWYWLTWFFICFEIFPSFVQHIAELIWFQNFQVFCTPKLDSLTEPSLCIP